MNQCRLPQMFTQVAILALTFHGCFETKLIRSVEKFIKELVRQIPGMVYFFKQILADGEKPPKTHNFLYKLYTFQCAISYIAK